jgi:hypothetical protein
MFLSIFRVTLSFSRKITAKRLDFSKNILRKANLPGICAKRAKPNSGARFRIAVETFPHGFQQSC